VYLSTRVLASGAPRGPWFGQFGGATGCPAISDGLMSGFRPVGSGRNRLSHAIAIVATKATRTWGSCSTNSLFAGSGDSYCSTLLRAVRQWRGPALRAELITNLESSRTRPVPISVCSLSVPYSPAPRRRRCRRSLIGTCTGSPATVVAKGRHASPGGSARGAPLTRRRSIWQTGSRCGPGPALGRTPHATRESTARAPDGSVPPGFA
jgi:hypothetical protein